MTGLIPPAVAMALLVIAAAVIMRRYPSTADSERLQQAARTLALTTSIQAAHFTEELVAGFHKEFPALFGLPHMPLSIFVGFNLGCLAIWSVSIGWIRTDHPVPRFAAWFLAIAGCANGVLHPLLAVAAGGYFPGLVTAPVIGVAGVRLYRRLARLAG